METLEKQRLSKEDWEKLCKTDYEYARFGYKLWYWGGVFILLLSGIPIFYATSGGGPIGISIGGAIFCFLVSFARKIEMNNLEREFTCNKEEKHFKEEYTED